jgi:hypothetical protein
MNTTKGVSKRPKSCALERHEAASSVHMDPQLEDGRGPVRHAVTVTTVNVVLQFEQSPPPQLRIVGTMGKIEGPQISCKKAARGV